ncbi:hypothetical protein F2P79_012938 [Pimephales promelas]|nr:hypothetical protein F2P79_012938 [Pimephales promelas]
MIRGIVLDNCAALKDPKASSPYSAQSLFLGIVCYCSTLQYTIAATGAPVAVVEARVLSSEGSCQTADYFWIKCEHESCESSGRTGGSSTHLHERFEAGCSEMVSGREESPGGRPQDTRP